MIFRLSKFLCLMLDAFFMYELQEAELESLGMVDPEGNWQIEREDLQALLAGRRTKLLRFPDSRTGEHCSIAGKSLG
jgi:hypothetical protein